MEPTLGEEEMKYKNTLIKSLALMQFTISVIFAATIIWGYITYQSSAGQFLKTLAETIGNISTVVVRTAEAVEDRKVMLDETQKTLLIARQLIGEVKVQVLNQMKVAPQYAADIRAISKPITAVGDVFQSVGEKIKELQMPSVKIDGVKPVITMTKPFEEKGREILGSAQNVKEAGQKLVVFSDEIARNTKKFTEVFVVTSDQLLRLIDETEKSLSRLKENDLPKAIADLKFTSGNLQVISNNINFIGNLGPILLVIGLLGAVWGMVQSLAMIVFVRVQR